MEIKEAPDSGGRVGAPSTGWRRVWTRRQPCASLRPLLVAKLVTSTKKGVHDGDKEHKTEAPALGRGARAPHTQGGAPGDLHAHAQAREGATRFSS